jgi:hypothetical protein
VKRRCLFPWESTPAASVAIRLGERRGPDGSIVGVLEFSIVFVACTAMSDR